MHTSFSSLKTANDHGEGPGDEASAESSLHMWRCGAEVLLDLSGYAGGEHQLEVCNT